MLYPLTINFMSVTYPLLLIAEGSEVDIAVMLSTPLLTFETCDDQPMIMQQGSLTKHILMPLMLILHYNIARPMFMQHVDLTPTDNTKEC